ncbi:MAG: hypothetical protein CMK07_05105 [Ponticaulis sp.]|nr:hypothetical protein [Ponticaulis sp.]
MSPPRSDLTSVTPTSVGLKPADTEQSGIRRRKRGKGWQFLNSSGTTVPPRVADRCRSLAIPPAWQDVWIATSAKAHIQAFGQDEAGRRQYIYHPDWQHARETAKFDSLLDFARALPRIRKQVRECLTSSECEQSLAICTVVGLLDEGSLRIGSRRYFERAGTVGATTLSREHIKLSSDHLELDFPAKGGKQRHVEIDDSDLIEAVQHFLSDNPSAAAPLIQVSAGQVNDFLQDVAGHRYTAKHFRTWNGSVAASEAIFRSDGGTSIKAAADCLGNTPAISRKSYIHPTILDHVSAPPDPFPAGGPTRLRAAERRCFGLISA